MEIETQIAYFKEYQQGLINFLLYENVKSAPKYSNNKSAVFDEIKEIEKYIKYLQEKFDNIQFEAGNNNYRNQLTRAQRIKETTIIK